MSNNATYRKITLNGEDHVLKYDFNAISELECLYDKGIFRVVTEETMGFNTIRSILWAGMLWRNPQLKVHHVGNMLEQEMDENEDFDFTELMKFTTEVLYTSKAFKLLAKRAEKEEKEGKN